MLDAFLIPFKEISVRCPEKNFFLFKYTIKWLNSCNISNENIFVIADTLKVIRFIQNQYKDINIILEQSKFKRNDIISTYMAAKDLQVKKYFIIPLTQPFRAYNLIENSKKLINQYDFITTFNIIQNRDIFELDENDKFKIDSIERKGCLCKNKKIIDGAFYLINTNFMDNIYRSENLNSAFWNGNFKTIYNNAPFFDLDTEEDKIKFEYIKEFFR